MKHPAHKSESAFDPNHFPALREFFSAYLHQDFSEEYGSATKAAESFCNDASKEEVLELQKEWRLLRDALRGKPLQELQTALAKLGGAWLPSTEAEFLSLDEILSRPRP